MTVSLELPELKVEGRNDLCTIAELLNRHGIDMSQAKRPINITAAGSLESLLDGMRVAVRAATNRPVGFVVDADVKLSDRWNAVRDRLISEGVDVPKDCPVDGFIGQRQGYTSRVGVWVMPDCSTDDGKLEHFLNTLVPSDDRLIGHAEQSTDEAIQLGAIFTSNDRIKAVIHTWLAWQKEPGRPFGTAICAEFFRHDSEVANRFVSWMRRLFDLT